MRLHVILVVDEDLGHGLGQKGLHYLLWGASFWLQGLIDTIFLGISGVDSIICIAFMCRHYDSSSRYEVS